MFAVIKTGGKQYKVKEGSRVKVEKLDVEKDASVEISDVLLIAHEDGSEVKIGNPSLQGAKVFAKAILQGRAKKIDVIKYKNKIRYRRKIGHRQDFTELEIEKITV